ncbi:MAG: PKD domain-containing protein [Chitinophagaceae bacterium]
MTFPYQPGTIKWSFNGLFVDTIQTNPVFDSTWILNGRTLYRFTLNKLYSINNTGTYPITLIADNRTSDGCSGEQQIDYDLQIFDKPKALFTISQSGCLSDPVNFSDSSNGNGRQVIKWLWNFGDGTSSVIKNPSHIYQFPGSYSIAYTSVTDIGCLSDTASKIVSFTEQPQAKFTLDQPACAGRSVKFTDMSTPLGGGLAKWQWDFGDGTTTDQQNPTHLFKSVGNYKIKLDIETTTGCKKSLTMPVTVNYLPSPNFALPEICLDDPFALFTDSSTIYGGNQLTYAWNFGDANATADNPNTSSIRNPSHSFHAVGVYDISMRVTSSEGCYADTLKKFTVNGAIPKADFSIRQPAPLCSNESVSITDRSSVDFGNITRLEIYWDYLNDPTAKTTDEAPVVGKTYSHKYVEFSLPLTKSFQIMYVAYSGTNCLNQKTMNVDLQASPRVAFDSIPGVCQEVTLLQVSLPKELSGLAGTGIFTGGFISSTGVFNPKAAGAGLHTLRYTFNAANGCASLTDKTIQVYATPTADAGPDRVVLEGGSVVIAARASLNSRYAWSPSLGMDNINVLTPKVSPKVDTRYQLQVASIMGCTAMDDVLVTVLRQIEVPNAFSPNGDAVNDTWKIPYLSSYPGATVEVYNRYGQLVFRSIGYGKEWDGAYNGSPLSMGTYYWIIDPKNGRPRMNGSVTLIR